jgi:hypothetical protein
MNKLARFCMIMPLVAVVFGLCSSSSYGQDTSAPNYVDANIGYKIDRKIVLIEPGGLSSDNLAVGYGALYSNTGGMGNTANGTGTMVNTSTGSYNTAVGFDALFDNTMGGSNTAIGFAAGNTTNIPTTGSNNTFVGAGTGPSNLTTLNNATAVGACAQVSASNALVLGALAGTTCASSNTNVGIDVGSPSNILTVLQGGGPAISDGWDTYSSRRWKTNIQTLQGALAKVERLRGVSYNLKDSGKHEVGVIAEEVGEVVPEVVSYEENGKDARGVDYGRLTALLIEATKEQQQEIRQERAELAKALRQIKQQQSVFRTQASAMKSLEAEVRETRETLRKVNVQVAAGQPTLVATK